MYDGYLTHWVSLPDEKRKELWPDHYEQVYGMRLLTLNGSLYAEPVILAMDHGQLETFPDMCEMLRIEVRLNKVPPEA